MDESAAAASKKKPSSSRLAGRHRSRSNGWSNRRPPERLDWPTISSVGVSANNAATATAATTVAVRQGKLVAAAAAAASSQESFSSSLPPPKSKRQRHNHHWVHHHHSTQASSTLSQQSTSSPPPRRRGGISSTSSNSNYTNDNSSSTIIHINNNNSNSNTNALWTEKYTPQQPSDLVVASKKVEQVSSWIQNALGTTSTTSSQRLLVLVGSPGIGKSAMIHCLARQQGSLGFNVLEWTESFATRTNETWQQQQGFMAVEQPSPINSFEAFLQQAAVGYSPLTMETSSSSQQQQHAASTAALSQQQQQQQQSKRKLSSSSQPQRKMAPNSSNNNNNNNSGHSRSVILLDELPYCHDDEAKNKFRNLLSNHIENSILPCILIFSNVLEGKHKPEDLEALIHARVLYSPNITTIVQIHAATKARLKRTLQHICQQEGIVVGTGTAKHQQQEYNLFQDLHFRSGGDVRFAITTLQYEYACNHHHHNTTNNNATSAAKKKNNTAKTTCANESERDQKLSMFHALGKLLYAKREQNSIVVSSSSNNNNQASDAGGGDNDKYNHHRAPLTFDPERVVEHCGIEVAGALSFLGYHSLDFYTDVEELSQAWDLFSDATYWLDRPTMDGSWYNTSYSAFPVGYASSLAGRAVACTNLHPAPHKFRQFSAPPVFEVMRKRRDNTSLIRHFQSRFDMLTMSNYNDNNISSSSHAVSGLSHSHPNELATDLAYVRMILPPEAASASQLQSHFGSVPTLQRRQQEEQETAAALLKEQEQVLRDDDIMDFDDDDNNNNNHSDEVITINKLTVGRGVMSLATENNKPSPTSSTDNIPVSSAMVKMRFK